MGKQANGKTNPTGINRRAFLTGVSAAAVGLGLAAAPYEAEGFMEKIIGKKNSKNRKLKSIKIHRTEGGPVSVEMPGKLGPQREVGGWPNLARVANLALGHFDEICDPERAYLPYVGGSLGYKTPAFSRCFWDWIEVLPYALIGRVAARRLTGNMQGIEIEKIQRKLLLSSFHNLDGFAYRTYAKGWCEDTSLSLWEQARVMYALLAWYEESGDERLLAYVRGIVEGLMRVSRKEGAYRLIDPLYDHGVGFQELEGVSVVECLTKYIEITGDPDALEYCQGVVNWAVDPKTHIFDERNRMSGFFRGPASSIASIARFASHTGDKKLLDRIEAIYRQAVGLCSRYGATPCMEPCCANMELTTAALALIKAGRGEWWDTIDRHFRNQVLACQFTPGDEVNAGYCGGQPGPNDDARDILKRSVGGFTWSDSREHLYKPCMLMLCCSGHAIWTLGKIAENAATLDGRTLAINLHYSLDTPLASMTNREPFEGRFEVTPHRDGQVKIRKPAYAGTIETMLDGKRASVKEQGGYLVFEDVRAESKIALSYALNERTTTEVVKLPWAKSGGYSGAEKTDPPEACRVQTLWIGNTVIKIDYDGEFMARKGEIPQPKHRLYLNRLEEYKRGAGKRDQVAFFLPERPLIW